MRETDVLKNEAGLFIEIYHIPSGRSVSMKAFLTRFTDNYTTTWNEEQVYGRPDPLTTFNATRRNLSISYEVIAEDIEEAKQNQIDLQMLARFQYPSYSRNERGATGISGAPLLKMKMLNLAWNAENRGQSESYNFHSPAATAGLVGKMSGFSNIINTDVGFLQDPESKALYPISYTLNFDYLVLHTHPIGWHGKDFRANGFPYGHRIDGDGSKKKAITAQTSKIQSVQEKEALAASSIVGDEILNLTSVRYWS